MSTLSDQKLYDFAEKLSTALSASPSLSKEKAEWKPIKDFVDNLKKKIEESFEWKIRENLNKHLKDALDVDSLEFDVTKSISYQEAYPRFDISIAVKRDKMIAFINDNFKTNSKIPNAKSSIANSFLKFVEDLDITVGDLGKIKKSMIGKVTVVVK